MISFVIPHFNDFASLRKLLKSIDSECKAAPCESYETIVVDDATPSSAEALTALKSEFPWVLFFQNDINSGPAFSRNFGVAKAKNEWIWLLDSDVYLAPGALRAIIGLFGEIHDYCGIGCGVGADAVSEQPFQRYKNYMEHSWQPAEGPTRSLDSKSFLIRKKTYEEIEGFRIQFDSPTVEDYDLCYRLLQSGHALYFTHRAKIFHHHPSYFKQCRLFFDRAAKWMQLKRVYGFEFDDYGTSKAQGALQVLNVACLATLPAVVFYPPILLFTFVGLCLWMILNGKALRLLAAKHEKPLFYLQFLFFSLTLGVPVCCGALVGLFFPGASASEATEKANRNRQ